MINGKQKTVMALAFEKAIAEGKPVVHCDVLIVDGTVYASGPHGVEKCKADQPQEIGLIIMEAGTGTKMKQRGCRPVINNKPCDEE